MEDVRIQRLADLITGYSLGVRSGDMVRLDGGAVAFPLVVALYRSVLKRGAHAYPHIAVDGLAEILLEEGSDEQVEWVSPLERNEIDLVDALVTIWGDVNTRALSGVDPARRGRQLATRRELRERRFARIEAGELRWVGTLFPTNAHAQDAGMSLGEYERFVYRACHCEDGEDAAAHWQATAAGLEAVARSFEAVRELRVVGPDTDLTLGVAGRPWVAADGHLNMPDGEIFTSPVETETRGEIRFQFPAIYEGREVEDVRLRFEGWRGDPGGGGKGRRLPRGAARDGGRAGARRGRVRAQLRDRSLHPQHPVRREDRRNDALRPGLRIPDHRREEQIGPPLGHDLRPARRGRGLCRRRAGVESGTLPGRGVIAVVADTHLPRGDRTLPVPCLELLAEASLVVHAGDFTAGSVLSELEALGSVEAVRGNMDDHEVRHRLPERTVVAAEGLTIGVVHDAGPAAGRGERLRAAFPGCDLVVYGHSHVPELSRSSGVWILNPGSPTERRRAPSHTMAVVRDGVPELVQLS